MTRRQDFRCPLCNRTARDVVVPDGVASQEAAPWCPNCSVSNSLQPDEICMVRMIWTPSTKAMDVGGVKTAAFQAIDVYDGRGRPVRVDSLHKLRQVERESEKLEADGLGQKMIWRDYSQDRSNRDQHTLTGHDTGQMADPFKVHERIQRAKGRFPHATGEAVTAEHGTIPVEE